VKASNIPTRSSITSTWPSQAGDPPMADRRNRHALRDGPRQRLDHALDHQREGTRRSDRIASAVIDSRCFRVAPARTIAAQRIDRLRREPE